jgi:hypothetical protein
MGAKDHEHQFGPVAAASVARIERRRNSGAAREADPGFSFHSIQAARCDQRHPLRIFSGREAGWDGLAVVPRLLSMLDGRAQSACRS